jgi:thioredoxin reductase (NADPH)
MLTVEHIRAVPLFSVKRVASAVGEGSMAIALVHQYLQREGRARGRS